MVYLPIVLQDNFKPLVKETIGVIIGSISDESEKVRNLAIKCIKTIIKGFMKDNDGQLTAPLVEGVFSDKYTRRISSIILLGDFLEIISEQTEDKDELYDTYSKVFASLYIAKSDENNEIKSNANNMFKLFVSNP